MPGVYIQCKITHKTFVFVSFFSLHHKSIERNGSNVLVIKWVGKIVLNKKADCMVGGNLTLKQHSIVIIKPVLLMFHNQSRNSFFFLFIFVGLLWFKAKKRGNSISAVVSEYRSLLERTQRRHGKLKPSLYLTYDELNEYLQQRASMSDIFFLFGFWKMLSAVFKAWNTFSVLSFY